MRMVDFVFLSGYNPLTPFILLVLVVIHSLMLRSESNKANILGSYFAPSIMFTTTVCLWGAPLAMGIFVEWRVPVMLLSVFAAVLLGTTCFVYSISSLPFHNLSNFSLLISVFGFTRSVFYINLTLARYSSKSQRGY